MCEMPDGPTLVVAGTEHWTENPIADDGGPTPKSMELGEVPVGGELLLDAVKTIVPSVPLPEKTQLTELPGLRSQTDTVNEVAPAVAPDANGHVISCVLPLVLIAP